MKIRPLVILPLLAIAALLSPSAHAQSPIFEIEPQQSSIKFYVKASVALTGTFDKWDATLKFTSPEVTTGVLDIEIQSASVDTGSGMKNNKLKGKDFFDVEQNPTISFKSTKIVQTGPNTFSVPGTFTIRGVSNPETVTLTVVDPKTDKSDVHGKMVFDRKDYGMHKGIPFIKIADHVEVNIHLKAKRIGGPLLIEKWPVEK
jgi:polyisoprenoid-binding protein YceI